MTNLLNVVAPIAALGTLYVVIPVATDAYRRFRGAKTVTCPETRAPAEIHLDLNLAATSSAFGPPHLKVTRCSRWPERHYCDQACVKEVAAQ